MLSGARRLQYVPYHLLDDQANVIVDGAANRNTRLILSHWPDSGTPQKFKADLSAQIVFNCIDLGTEADFADAKAVSNNHFDEDGLVSLYAILNQAEASSKRDFLIDVARAGDFSKFNDRDAARVSFVISAWSDPDRSPLNRTAFSGSHDQLSQILYEELLDRLPAIIGKIGHFQPLWAADDAFLDLTEKAISSGKIEITQDQALDLAIVTIPDGGIAERKEKPKNAASWVSSQCHPMAVHNVVDCHRVLVHQGRQFAFYYRYETWVDYVSRLLPPRVDLTDFARRLSAIEGNGRWRFSGVGDIIARLELEGKKESRLSPNQFVKLLKEELSGATNKMMGISTE